MIFDIENLGAVIKGQVEIKPLTVFIGPNNTGKTWAAYGIAGIFGPMSWKIYTSSFLDGKLEEKYPEIEALIETLFDRGNAKIDIITFFKDNGVSYFNNLSKLLPLWLNRFFSTDNVPFNNLSISITGDINLKNPINKLLQESIDKQISPDKDGQPIVKIHKDEQDSLIYFYLSENRKEELPKKILINSIYKTIFRSIHRALYYNVRYLPAERTGILALLTSEVIVSNKTNDKEQDSQFDSMDSIMPPMPINNMIYLLGIIKQSSKYNATLKKRMNNKSLNKFFDLANVLENELLNGMLECNEDKENNGVSNLYYRYKENNNVLLELPIVSSTVKDLAPLSVYLKCFLNNNDLLVIDEPEMNLHPINQAKFIEFLVMLVNSGVNLMLTTHSPYMANHLESLIKAFDSEQLNLESSFYLKRRDAFISKENVSVYYFGNGGIKSILEENGSIDLESFSEVGEEISEIYYEIE